MSLADQLDTPPAPHQKSAALDNWVAGLPERDRQAVEAAAVNPEWGHLKLLNELETAGAPEISVRAFREWRVRRGWKK